MRKIQDITVKNGPHPLLVVSVTTALEEFSMGAVFLRIILWFLDIALK